jgi:hypothetical protein
MTRGLWHEPGGRLTITKASWVARLNDMNRFANFLMFYVGWIACVAGAGRGALWAGPATAAVLLLGHLALAPNRVREGVLVLIVGVFGFAVDTLQASVGLYAFSGTSTLAWLCPPWMTALWMLFAATLNGSMGWLAGRYRLAAVLGGLLGPLSYLAGERLGAITLSSNAFVGLGGIAIVWALVMPALLWIREVLSGAGADAPFGRWPRPLGDARIADEHA